ncbi:MAG TPA: hypothetical protein VMV68_05845 [Spirochaetia bacterium]|nr:hypothetical protein [Spirochaetia bacterium]
MVTIGKKQLLALMTLVCGATLFIGIFGYFSTVGSGGGAAERTFQAQQVLYVSLLVLIAEIFASVQVFRRSRDLIRELDKIIELSKHSGFSPTGNVRRLGPIGARIDLLYHSLSSLNDKKTLKISALSGLVEFLCDNIALPLVVTTVTGTIVHASRSLAERVKFSQAELMERPIEEILHGIAFAEVAAEIDKSHSPIDREIDKNMLTFYPIRNRDANLAYVVCGFHAHPFLVRSPQKVVREGTKKVGISLKRLLGMGKARKRRD